MKSSENSQVNVIGVRRWKMNRYEHGGARFYTERPSGDARTPVARTLQIDTYNEEATEIVHRALSEHVEVEDGE